MMDNFPFLLGLTLAIVLLIMLADKIKVAYPVLLVLAGLVISLVPGLPRIHIESELIFIIFLPPLLYDAAWNISWKELWKWRRIVGSFAFLVVLFSALSVAVVANYIIPGFTLALGLLLGGIVSPPDAVSAGAILKFVKVPSRVSSILAGESLLNDASSLIIFRFALIAIATGQFIWYEAAWSLVWMVAGGIGSGLLIGLIMMKLHKYLPTDANIDIALSIITPYLMYIGAEEVHASGVLAVVSGGLFLSYRRFGFLSSSSRLRGTNVWDSLSFLLNGLVFMLIGLDLPQITAGLGDVSIALAIGYGLLISFVLIGSRILSSYAAVITTMIARNFITVADANPGFRSSILIGWSGMRGVVSLAAALSIPLALSDGSAFPQRNLILFITFIVIITTLLVQGLTLPYIIKRVGLKEVDYPLTDEEMYLQIKKELNDYTISYLIENCSEEVSNKFMRQQIITKWDCTSPSLPENILTDEDKKVYKDLLMMQREWLVEKNKNLTIQEEVIRKHLLLLDIEQERLGLL